jgi:hypothetical protein
LNYILTIIIFFLIQINFVQAESIKFYNFECSGVLRSNNITSIAKWKINFINANRATLDLYYDNKKRSADLRISIQKNQDFFANGKWRGQTTQRGRFVRLKYIDSSMKLTLGPNGNNSLRAEGKCKKKDIDLSIPQKQSVIKKIKNMVFIITEHSKYSLNHPDDSDNILRHLKHTCHAIDSNLVKERPMPAGEESLTEILDKNSNFAGDLKEIIFKIKKVSNNSKDKCQRYLYSWEKNNELLETAHYIHSNFVDIHNELTTIIKG